MLTRTSDESALECEIRIWAGEWWWATVNMFLIWTMGKVKSQIESEAVLSRCLVSRPSWKFQFQTHRFYWFLILESVSSTKACEWIICLVEGNSLYNWIHHTHLLVHVCHVFKCITIRITKIWSFPWKYWISRECPDVFRYEVQLCDSAVAFQPQEKRWREELHSRGLKEHNSRRIKEIFPTRRKWPLKPVLKKSDRPALSLQVSKNLMITFKRSIQKEKSEY